jgi:hypothetical protein
LLSRHSLVVSINFREGARAVNNIIYLVGLVVIVVAIVSFVL